MSLDPINLVVIDTKTMRLTAYQEVRAYHQDKAGKWITEALTSRLTQAELTLDEDTTVEGLKTVIEDFRKDPGIEDYIKVASLKPRVLDKPVTLKLLGRTPGKSQPPSPITETISYGSFTGQAQPPESDNPYRDPFVIILDSPIDLKGLPTNPEILKLLEEIEAEHKSDRIRGISADMMMFDEVQHFETEPEKPD